MFSYNVSIQHQNKLDNLIICLIYTIDNSFLTIFATDYN